MKTFTHTIYLDHAAATPLRTEALNAMLPHLRETYGNPSSIHHQGRTAFDALEAARAAAAKVLNVAPSEIIFTGSGTEANNLALLGVAHGHLSTSGKNHILVSSIEHKSVLEAAARLAEEGLEVEYLPVDGHGRIDVAKALAHVRPTTGLISIMYANNEIGTVEPIAELSAALNTMFPQGDRPLMHTDACQAVGQLPIRPHDLGVDLMTINSSKVYGPKGVGMLYVSSAVALAPHTLGGDQESGRRGGTENIAGIAGFVRALELAAKEEAGTVARLSKLRDGFIAELAQAIPDVVLNGHPTERLSNNVHISLHGVEGEALVLMLDTYGICTSTGSACNARDLAPSHVLRALGQSHELIHGSLRFTMGHETTSEDLSYVVASLSACVTRLRSFSAMYLHL